MARPPRPMPVAHVVAGEWPHADLQGEDALQLGQAFAARLKDAVGGMSLREVEARTRVDHTTIDNILHGRAWPDILTLARLETGLKRRLWPGPTTPTAASATSPGAGCGRRARALD